MKSGDQALEAFDGGLFERCRTYVTGATDIAAELLARRSR